MSLPATNLRLRDCLWEVHLRKCIYCKKPKLSFEIEVDHIIPESLDGNPGARTKLFASHGIPLDHPIQDYENFAPSCGPCNRDKSDDILPVGQLGIILAKVAKALPRLRARLENEQAKIGLDKVLRLITSAVSSKQWSVGDLTNRLRELGYLNDAWKFQSNSEQLSSHRNSIEWDEDKNAFNYRKHGVDFNSILNAMEHGVILAAVPSGPHGGQDDRFRLLTKTGLVIMYTITIDNVVRIISARKATKHEMNQNATFLSS